MICWMNGKLLPAEELRISPFDHGFLYGLGFFETFRTYGGKLFLFEEHMARLHAALYEYRISMPYTNEDIRSAVHALYEANGREDGYYRLNVSAGVHDIGLAPTAYEKPNVLLFQKALHVAPAHTEKEGVWLETVRSEPESSARHKSHQYANNVRARLELPSLKEMEGFFLTADGWIAEGITSNIFFARGGVLYTPSLETGILAGTTRAFIIEQARAAGMRAEEGLYRKEQLEQANEVFITNAVQHIVPIKSVGGYSFEGSKGEIYRQLHDLYEGAVRQTKESDSRWS